MTAIAAPTSLDQLTIDRAVAESEQLGDIARAWFAPAHEDGAPPTVRAIAAETGLPRYVVRRQLGLVRQLAREVARETARLRPRRVESLRDLTDVERDTLQAHLSLTVTEHRAAGAEVLMYDPGAPTMVRYAAGTVMELPGQQLVLGFELFVTQAFGGDIAWLDNDQSEAMVLVGEMRGQIVPNSFGIGY